MIEHEFVVRLRGRGEDEDEAWNDALDAFFSEPGDPEDVEEIGRVDDARADGWDDESSSEY
jgi:hypothetical protein